MSFLAPIAAIAGAAGSIFSGLATGEAASYQAQVADMNAKIAQQNASRAIQAGQAKVYAEGQKNAAQSGQIKAALAANGVDVNSGSALATEVGQRETGELDTQTAMNNAELEAYGYKTQASGFQAQANLDTAEAEEAPVAGVLNAGGGLLANASSISNKWGSPLSNTSGSSSLMSWSGLG
jgi:hypothetical protein